MLLQVAQEEQQPPQQMVAVAVPVAALLVATANPVPLAVVPRPLPVNCQDDEQAFIREFEERVIDLVRQFRRRFRYKHSVVWSMEYGDKQRSIHVMANARRS